MIEFCFQVVRVDSIEEMNDLVDQAYFETESTVATYFVGVFFNLEDPTNESVPYHLNYDLRMQHFWFTNYIYPFVQVNGPRNGSCNTRNTFFILNIS